MLHTILNKTVYPIYRIFTAKVQRLSKLRITEIAHFLDKTGLLISVILVVTCFIFTRLGFFLDFRLPDFAIDYWSYFDLLDQARHGHWPKLTLRTPGYPLFLATIFLISKQAISVVIAQCILTLVVALVTLTCFVRADKRFAYPAAFAIIGFISSMHSVVFDTTLMSESLYCSMFMLSIGLLTLAILRDNAWALGAASFAISAFMLTKPAGFFFWGILGVILIWLLIRRVSRQHILLFLSPVLIIFLTVCIYNWFTINAFVASPFGELKLIGTVATYMEEDPAAPSDVNAAVRAIRNSMTPSDRSQVFMSYDPDVLSSVFSRYFDSAIYTHMAKVQRDYMELRPIYKKLAMRSIRQHPGIYLKFASANFYKLYDNALITPNLYEELRVRFDRTHMGNYFVSYSSIVRRDMLMEYWNPNPQPHVRLVGKEIAVDDTMIRRMHIYFNRFHEGIYSRWIWFLGALILFPITVWQLIQRRGRDVEMFLVFVNLSALLGAGIIIALVQMPMTRYGSTLLFLGYLTPFNVYLLARRRITVDIIKELFTPSSRLVLHSENEKNVRCAEEIEFL